MRRSGPDAGLRGHPRGEARQNPPPPRSAAGRGHRRDARPRPHRGRPGWPNDAGQKTKGCAVVPCADEDVTGSAGWVHHGVVSTPERLSRPSQTLAACTFPPKQPTYRSGRSRPPTFTKESASARFRRRRSVCHSDLEQRPTSPRQWREGRLGAVRPHIGMSLTVHPRPGRASLQQRFGRSQAMGAASKDVPSW